MFLMDWIIFLVLGLDMYPWRWARPMGHHRKVAHIIPNRTLKMAIALFLPRRLCSTPEPIFVFSLKTSSSFSFILLLFQGFTQIWQQVLPLLPRPMAPAKGISFVPLFSASLGFLTIFIMQLLENEISDFHWFLYLSVFSLHDDLLHG